jgi:hypothetical protein
MMLFIDAISRIVSISLSNRRTSAIASIALINGTSNVRLLHNGAVYSRLLCEWSWGVVLWWVMQFVISTCRRLANQASGQRSM